MQGSLETCDDCMMRFDLQNHLQRRRNELKRDITQEESDTLTAEFLASNTRISEFSGENALYPAFLHVLVLAIG